MDPHRAEVAGEARFHEIARDSVQRFARRPQHITDFGRSDGGSGTGRRAMEVLFFLLTAIVTGPAARTLPLHLWLRHPHHLVGDAIGFNLVGIARSIDAKLGLQRSITSELLNPRGRMHAA